MRNNTRFKASVIVPTYNREKMLAKTLQSLVASDMPADAFEIVIVDDGSSDATYELVRTFIDTADCQIRYIYQKDKGYRLARARNLGLELAEGEVCILLDCGVVVSQGCVRAHVEAHSSPSALVIGYVFGFSNTGNDDEALGRALEALDLDNVEAMLERFRAEDRFADMRERTYRKFGENLMDLPAPWAISWGCNLSVRRETLGERFLYDENYATWGAEDLDFALALYLSGVEFKLSRDASSIHIPHGKSHEVNSASSRPNKIYLHGKFQRMETEMLIDVQSFDLNDALADQRLTT
ncbi:glycosyltransferase [Martelella limonii]|uniref:glycosyltransferase n=1 Tax=Martelella limonii TaxID=1647649 RepID=UPI0015800F7A|nr:glycosyltransferase [Martelella limonii]